MANVKIKGIKELAQRLNRNIKIEVAKLFRDADLRAKIGSIIVNDIKLNYEAPNPPADSTLEWRRRYDPINKTDPAYRREKIKAVFTGELLEDLAKNIKSNPTNFSFEVAHSNKKHRKYQGKTKKIGGNSTYQEISEGLIEKLGYNYMVLSDEAKTEIAALVRDRVFKLLDKVG
jgi:hypothetical protein